MARNGSGVYSLPANTAAVSGDPVSSSKFNTLVQDLEAVLNTPRPVVKGGTGSTTAAGARTALGLEIGTNVQAYNAALLSIAGLTTAANKMIYATAADTYAVADLSAFARTLLDDADAGTALTTLGVSAYAKTILDDATAGDALTTLGVSAFAKTILDDVDAAAVRATIGAGTGNGDLLASNNLSDVGSATTARSNIAAYGAGDNASFGTLAVSGDTTIGTNALVVDVSADRVGIGTTLPDGRLHVADTDTETVLWNRNANFVLENKSTTDNTWEGIQFEGSSGAIAAGIAAQFTDTSAGYADLHFATRGSGGFNGSALVISSAGNVGIGTTSITDKLQVNGDVGAVDFNASSDQRLKENFRPFDQGLEYVLATEIIRFSRIGQEGEHIGPLAQQMEIGFPEGVNTGSDPDGFKSVDILNMLGASYNAIQRLHARLEAVENGGS